MARITRCPQALVKNMPPSVLLPELALPALASALPARRRRADRPLRCCTAHGTPPSRPSFGNEERNDASPTPPLVQPSAALTARAAVEVQLAALQHNDTPRRDHGLETTYLFAAGTGGFGLSRYFGFSAGTLLRALQNRLPSISDTR